MATDQQVAAQRAKTDAAREAVRQARVAQSATALAGENDVKLASLTSEEAMLQQELARLTGSEAAPAPAAPAPAASAKADTPKEG